MHFPRYACLFTQASCHKRSNGQEVAPQLHACAEATKWEGLATLLAGSAAIRAGFVCRNWKKKNHNSCISILEEQFLALRHGVLGRGDCVTNGPLRLENFVVISALQEAGEKSECWKSQHENSIFSCVVNHQLHDHPRQVFVTSEKPCIMCQVLQQYHPSTVIPHHVLLKPSSTTAVTNGEISICSAQWGVTWEHIP